MTNYKHRPCEQICCPHCLKEYDFSTVEPCYTHQFRGSDELFYVGLCSGCHRKLLAENKPGKRGIVHRVGPNILFHPDKWLSATTEVAMVVHGGDFAAALLHGHGLNKKAYNAIKKGNYAKSPWSSPRLIMSWGH
jgi:hypothetical protein